MENIEGNTVTTVLNSKVTNKLRANAAQKKDKNKAASLKINQIKQYWITRYKEVTSLIPYKVSVKISMNKKLKEKSKIKKIKNILKKSKVKVQRDNPKNVNKQNTKYIKNIAE